MEFSSDPSTLALLALGFLLGLRHAVEADHLAAVSTIVSERDDLLGSAAIGAVWGVGHTLTLFIVGIAVVFLKLRISESVEAGLEAGVGIMLVILGFNAFRKMRSAAKIHMHTHEHGGREHTHIHTHGDEPEETHHLARFNFRSLLVGMVHGLAGSAALMLLVLPAVSSTTVALIYIIVFGVGSIGGMVVMSFIIGLPLQLTARRFEFANRAIIFLAGAFSLGLGAFIIYEKLG